MHVLVTGATGLVGSALLPALRQRGDSASCLLRPSTRVPEDFKFGRIGWDPDRGYIDAEALHKVDAVVHLAGENIAAARWNEKQKGRIRQSRVGSTRLLCEAIATRSYVPKTLVCASATGFYGDRGAELLSEDSPAGAGFLPDVCKEWEAASQPAEARGIRVVRLRLGVVLSPRGGALAKMLTPFRLGVGGVIGSGAQFMSWIALDDVVAAILFALDTAALDGAVNGVAPQAVTNREFTRTLARVLGRPAIFPMPAFAARLAFGEMADALLLASARVQPGKLLAAGFSFRFPDLEGALRHLLK